MNNNLQLFLIFLICSFLQCWEHTTENKCIKLKNYNLRIPNNAIAEGEGKEGNASWYHHVNWKDTPAGHLSVHYVMDREDSDGWRTVTATSDPSIVNRPAEENDWENFVERLMGLTCTSVKIPGRVRVPQTIFDEDQSCILFHFKRTLYSGRYRVFLNYTDDDGNKVLTGQVLFTN